MTNSIFFGPFGWMLESLDEISRVMAIVQEARDVDAERMLTGKADPKTARLQRMLKDLDLDPKLLRSNVASANINEPAPTRLAA